MQILQICFVKVYIIFGSQNNVLRSNNDLFLHYFLKNKHNAHTFMYFFHELLISFNRWLKQNKEKFPWKYYTKIHMWMQIFLVYMVRQLPEYLLCKIKRQFRR